MFLGNPLYYYLYWYLYYNVAAVATRWGTLESDVVANAYIMPTSRGLLGGSARTYARSGI
jgi:hypothetical protein